MQRTEPDLRKYRRIDEVWIGKIRKIVVADSADIDEMRGKVIVFFEDGETEIGVSREILPEDSLFAKYLVINSRGRERFIGEREFVSNFELVDREKNSKKVLTQE